jgi:pimeloyl-ACP methyl ester carboxylesterase
VSTFLLIHGAGDGGWYWHLVAAELRSRGHDVVAPDLPGDDESTGLNEYADAVVEATGDRRDLVVVGQSFGAFTAPLVADRLPVDVLVLVAGMMPSRVRLQRIGGRTPTTETRCGSKPRVMEARPATKTRT